MRWNIKSFFGSTNFNKIYNSYLSINLYIINNKNPFFSFFVKIFLFLIFSNILYAMDNSVLCEFKKNGTDIENVVDDTLNGFFKIQESLNDLEKTNKNVYKPLEPLHAITIQIVNLLSNIDEVFNLNKDFDYVSSEEQKMILNSKCDPKFYKEFGEHIEQNETSKEFISKQINNVFEEFKSSNIEGLNIKDKAIFNESYSKLLQIENYFSKK